MARPKSCRRIARHPGYLVFKPAGVGRRAPAEIVLGMDELEAIRLADRDGLYQEEAAERMNVSRQTFGRILMAAREKIARALVEGMILRIEGGEIEMAGKKDSTCLKCGDEWEVPFGTGRPAACPKCESTDIRRTGGRRRRRCRKGATS